ncbi:hypothetical protein DPMN_181531, partial [Dreissena polymorpha]
LGWGMDIITPFPKFLNKLSEFYLLTSNAIQTVENIRHNVRNQLMQERKDTPGTEESEFPPKVDVCYGANIDFPPLDITFFRLTLSYLLRGLRQRCGVISLSISYLRGLE